jgi:hypothetical protein
LSRISGLAPEASIVCLANNKKSALTRIFYTTHFIMSGTAHDACRTGYSGIIKPAHATLNAYNF